MRRNVMKSGAVAKRSEDELHGEEGEKWSQKDKKKRKEDDEEEEIRKAVCCNKKKMKEEEKENT